MVLAVGVETVKHHPGIGIGRGKPDRDRLAGVNADARKRHPRSDRRLEIVQVGTHKTSCGARGKAAGSPLPLTARRRLTCNGRNIGASAGPAKSRILSRHYLSQFVRRQRQPVGIK